MTTKLTKKADPTNTPPIVPGTPVESNTTHAASTTNPEQSMMTATSVPTAASTTTDSDRVRLRLMDLERAIQEVAAEIGGILKRAVPHARQMGGLLAEAKTEFKSIDGEDTFADWVQAKFKMAIQTANRYIRIHANWDRMATAGYEPQSIEDAAQWISDNPAPDADQRGGANNATGPKPKKLELPKTFLTVKRLQRAGKSAEDFKAVANEALAAAGVNYQFV